MGPLESIRNIILTIYFAGKLVFSDASLGLLSVRVSGFFYNSNNFVLVFLKIHLLI